MLGVIGALRVEIDGLLNLMSDKTEVKAGNFTFTKGYVSGKEIVVMYCGVGKVFSSTAAALMIEKFNVTSMINIGVAGGIKPLVQGDIVLSDKAVQHDYMATADGLLPGQVQGFDSPYFACDSEMVSNLSKAIAAAGYECNIGTIASGDQFINSSGKIAELKDLFDPKAVDMESAAIAQVCAYQNVKFVAMRAISDNGDEEAVLSFYDFVEMAAKRTVESIAKYIEYFV